MDITLRTRLSRTTCRVKTFSFLILVVFSCLISHIQAVSQTSCFCPNQPGIITYSGACPFTNSMMVVKRTLSVKTRMAAPSNFCAQQIPYNSADCIITDSYSDWSVKNFCNTRAGQCTVSYSLDDQTLATCNSPDGTVYGCLEFDCINSTNVGSLPNPTVYLSSSNQIRYNLTTSRFHVMTSYYPGTATTLINQCTVEVSATSTVLLRINDLRGDFRGPAPGNDSRCPYVLYFNTGAAYTDWCAGRNWGYSEMQVSPVGGSGSRTIDVVFNSPFVDQLVEGALWITIEANTDRITVRCGDNIPLYPVPTQTLTRSVPSTTTRRQDPATSTTTATTTSTTSATTTTTTAAGQPGQPSTTTTTSATTTTTVAGQPGQPSTTTTTSATTTTTVAGQPGQPSTTTTTSATTITTVAGQPGQPSTTTTTSTTATTTTAIGQPGQPSTTTTMTTTSAATTTSVAGQPGQPSSSTSSSTSATTSTTTTTTSRSPVGPPGQDSTSTASSTTTTTTTTISSSSTTTTTMATTTTTSPVGPPGLPSTTTASSTTTTTSSPSSSTTTTATTSSSTKATSTLQQGQPGQSSTTSPAALPGQPSSSTTTTPQPPPSSSTTTLVGPPGPPGTPVGPPGLDTTSQGPLGPGSTTTLQQGSPPSTTTAKWFSPLSLTPGVPTPGVPKDLAEAQAADFITGNDNHNVRVVAITVACIVGGLILLVLIIMALIWFCKFRHEDNGYQQGGMNSMSRSNYTATIE